MNIDHKIDHLLRNRLREIVYPINCNFWFVIYIFHFRPPLPEALWLSGTPSEGLVDTGWNLWKSTKPNTFTIDHADWHAAAAKSLQSCPTLCDPIDGSPPGSPVPRILQARTLEWVAISFSIAWKWKNKVKSLSRVQLLATPWTAAHQAPPSMGFSRQEYWSGLPLSSLKKSSSYS